MAKTILQIKEDLTGIIHSTSLDRVKNLNALFSRSARNLLSKIDPADTIRTAEISNAVHGDIYDYDDPIDLKGKKVIDLRPQHSRQESENPSQRFSKAFDLEKDDDTFQVRYNKGVKTLRIALDLATPKTLHDCNSLTDNGTWAATLGATNLTSDSLNYVSGSASLNFDLTVTTTTGYVEISDMAAIDLSDEEDIAKIFARVYIPDTSKITNFILTWGSSSTAYWSVTVTSPHDQSTFKNGWQTLAFDWNGATETGSPDSSAINYLKLLVTYDGVVETDLRVDKITASSGEIWEIEYYSEYLFSTTGGTWKATTDSDEDTVNLDEDGINIFEYECALAIAQQIQGSDSVFDRNFFHEELYGDGRDKIGLYQKYNEAHPSEAIKPRSYYWRPDLYNKRR